MPAPSDSDRIRSRRMNATGRAGQNPAREAIIDAPARPATTMAARRTRRSGLLQPGRRPGMLGSAFFPALLDLSLERRAEVLVGETQQAEAAGGVDQVGERRRRDAEARKSRTPWQRRRDRRRRSNPRSTRCHRASVPPPSIRPVRFTKARSAAGSSRRCSRARPSCSASVLGAGRPMVRLLGQAAVDKQCQLPRDREAERVERRGRLGDLPGEHLGSGAALEGEPSGKGVERGGAESVEVAPAVDRARRGPVPGS